MSETQELEKDRISLRLKVIARDILLLEKTLKLIFEMSNLVTERLQSMHLGTSHDVLDDMLQNLILRLQILRQLERHLLSLEQYASQKTSEVPGSYASSLRNFNLPSKASGRS